jgi:hypothetical protein
MRLEKKINFMKDCTIRNIWISPWETEIYRELYFVHPGVDRNSDTKSQPRFITERIPNP